MRVLKQAIIAIAVFSIMLLFFSFLLPSGISVSRSVLIHAPKDSIMAALLHIDGWKHWHPALQDSGAKYSIVSPRRVDWITPGGVSHSIQLKQFAPDSISVIVQSENKQVFTSGFIVAAHPQDGLLAKVEWWISEDIKWYPWEKFYGLFSESFRETYMDNTLQRFRHYIEHRQPE